MTQELFAQQRNALDLAQVSVETQFLWSLRSPFITRFYGISKSANGSLLIVQEMCKCAFKDLIDSQCEDVTCTAVSSDAESEAVQQEASGGHREKMTEVQWLLALHQSAQGVEYCHARGIVHRDLKPVSE